MRAKAWKGGAFGIRVGKANARRFFDATRPMVEVEIDGKWDRFLLSKTFWTGCPEIRGVPIRSWLRDHGLDSWPQRHPPEIELTPVGDNRFRLSQI
jgi:hypothetical protein